MPLVEAKGPCRWLGALALLSLFIYNTTSIGFQPYVFLLSAVYKTVVPLLESPIQCSSLTHLTGGWNGSLFTPNCNYFDDWSVNASVACLRRAKVRRVYVLGNSVARGMVFEAVARWGIHFANNRSLSTTERSFDALPRKEQQVICNSTESSVCKFGKDHDPTALHFVWLQMYNNGLAGMPGDSCGGGGSSDPNSLEYRQKCLEQMLAGSEPGDILLFLVGLHYVAHYADIYYNNGTHAQWQQSVTNGINAWPAAISTAWGGREEDIYRVRAPPVLGTINRLLVNNASRTREEDNALFDYINNVSDATAAAHKWKTIDQHGINSAKNEWYSDNAHFPGKLSFVTWKVVLSSLCGDPAALDNAA